LCVGAPLQANIQRANSAIAFEGRAAQMLARRVGLNRMNQLAQPGIHAA